MWCIRKKARWMSAPLQRAFSAAADRPEALLCWNDFAALEALSEAKRMGIDVPRDVAIVGFDNTAFCRLEQNSLTSIDLFAEFDWRERCDHAH